MSSINLYLLFLGINLLIDFAVPILFGANLASVVTDNMLWLYPIGVVLCGVLFGFLISLFVSKAGERKAYLWGQIISSAALFVILLNWSYTNLR